MAATTSRKQAAHPPYLQMITEAIGALKERTGSSVPAMAKFLEQKYGESLPENFRKMLTLQLKKLVMSQRLVKVKNSFKLATRKRIKPDNTESKEKKSIPAAASNKKGKDKSKAESSRTVKTVSESSRKNQKKGHNVKVGEAKKVVKKAMKTKRLSLVKSPASTNKAKKKGNDKAGAKEKPKKVNAKSDPAPGKATKKKSTVAAKK